MLVAVVGAGALGCVYGGLLSKRGGVDVAFVVRPGRVAGGLPVRLSRVDGDRREDSLEGIRVHGEIPEGASAVLVCVRREQLGTELISLLRGGPDVPAVFLTPLLPDSYDTLRQELGPRMIPAMPSVVSYFNDAGVCRYWLPRVAATLIEEPDQPIPALTELVHALVRAGIPSKSQANVHLTNAATTISTAPLMMALGVAGGVDPLLADGELVRLGIAATHEGAELAATIGHAAAWIGLLSSFLSPMPLRLGAKLARTRAPEALNYLDHHFGHKLHEQHISIADSMIALAIRKGIPHHALGALRDRLRAPVPSL